MLEIRPCSYQDAKEFVKENHRHNRPHCSLCKVARKMQASCSKYLMLRYCPHCVAKMDGGEDGENA